LSVSKWCLIAAYQDRECQDQPKSAAGGVPPRLPDGVGGLVSKNRDSVYRGGFDRWIKVKNRGHPDYGARGDD